MSQAERLSNALALADHHAYGAAEYAARYRARGADDAWSVLLANVGEVRLALDNLQALTNTRLPSVAKSLADDACNRLVNGHTPDHQPWPDAVKNAAAEADRALTNLRGHLEKTPAAAACNALTVLSEAVRAASRNRANR